ncbi:hypothetical protein AAFF_G00409770 [Aldrovandia affinis]|uniref:Uncharacterized protein n=1 Tax=Aldrovandia affinis TaxID=143900 RepID=A0AAD7WJQ4_9TELE|nr:hypothetical protein AAFF_G00409770 [Aldrovandia affinis]
MKTLKEDIPQKAKNRLVSETGILKTSWSSGNQVAITPRIKSYRIRIPPSPWKSALLGRNTLELDAKSDSSEQNDSLALSPAVMKSPGAQL